MNISDILTAWGAGSAIIVACTIAAVTIGGVTAAAIAYIHRDEL